MAAVAQKHSVSKESTNAPRHHASIERSEGSPRHSFAPTVGNQALQRALNREGGHCPDCLRQGGMPDHQAAPQSRRRPIIQAKLSVNAPGDSLEQEADRVADHVMSAPRASGSPPVIQRTCPECEEALHKKGGATPAIGPAEEQQVNAARQGGRPLPSNARLFLEPRVGHDLGHVRVHSGAAAASATHSLNAQAFTIGHDIVFGEGEYAPETSGGMHLLAHEVAHTIQQSGRGGEVQRTIGDGHDLTSPRFALDPVLEACFDNEDVLEFGDRGAAVATVQHALVEFGFLLLDFGVDGIFGAETRQAVRDFQTFVGLTGAAVDGRIGPTTMGLLDTNITTAPPVGPAPIPNIPAPSGTAPTLTPTVTTPPAPGNCGNMNFVVRWDLSGNSSRRGGFIIQDITITWNEVDCAGAPVADPAGHVSPLRYWEAWRVDPRSTTVTPVNTDTFAWAPGLGTGCTVDAVAFNGVAQYHDNVAALPDHMTAGNAATKAGILQSSTADPNVGGDVSPAVAHTLNFHWGCCGGPGGTCAVTPTVVDGHTP